MELLSHPSLAFTDGKGKTHPREGFLAAPIPTLSGRTGGGGEFHWGTAVSVMIIFTHTIAVSTGIFSASGLATALHLSPKCTPKMISTALSWFISMLDVRESWSSSQRVKDSPAEPR